MIESNRMADIESKETSVILSSIFNSCFEMSTETIEANISFRTSFRFHRKGKEFLRVHLWIPCRFHLIDQYFRRKRTDL